MQTSSPLPEERQFGDRAWEAATMVDADRSEGAPRGAWAHNVDIDIARMQRGGGAFVVVRRAGAAAA
jgi:hypothetical protein